MDSTPTGEVLHDFSPSFRIYKDGRIERYIRSLIIPASDDPQTGVRSKDVVISPENEVSARLFLPKTVKKDEKLPVLIYIHGGAFVIGSAFSSTYHGYVSSMVAEANVLAVSVQYRLAPEHPISACFDDSWAAMKWVASHANGRRGPEPWINDHADFTRVFAAGDSAGATMTHYTVARAGFECDGGFEDGVKIVGMILIHPFFGCGQREGLWETLCSDKTGPEDPRLNPMAHPNLLSSLICSKVLVCTAGKDFLRDRGRLYYEALKNSGWGGEVEIVESEGEDHVFHLMNPSCENAGILMKRVVSFFK